MMTRDVDETMVVDSSGTGAAGGTNKGDESNHGQGAGGGMGAAAVAGNVNEEEIGDGAEEGTRMAAVGRGVKRRQYKKDTIYLYDLYTLTYDNNEQVESIEMFNTIENENVSLQRDLFYIVIYLWVDVGVTCVVGKGCVE